MLLSSARTNPCSALTLRSSLALVTTTCPLSTVTPIPGVNVQSNLPSGPFTDTTGPATLTSTPAGTAIGLFPMRDIASSSLFLNSPTRPSLPDRAEDFTAKACFAGRLVRHDALRGRQNGHPDAVPHTRNVLSPHVDPSPG